MERVAGECEREKLPSLAISVEAQAVTATRHLARRTPGSPDRPPDAKGCARWHVRAAVERTEARGATGPKVTEADRILMATHARSISEGPRGASAHRGSWFAISTGQKTGAGRQTPLHGSDPPATDCFYTPRGENGRKAAEILGFRALPFVSSRGHHCSTNAQPRAPWSGSRGLGGHWPFFQQLFDSTLKRA